MTADTPQSDVEVALWLLMTALTLIDFGKLYATTKAWLMPAHEAPAAPGPQDQNVKAISYWARHLFVG